MAIRAVRVRRRRSSPLFPSLFIRRLARHSWVRPFVQKHHARAVNDVRLYPRHVHQCAHVLHAHDVMIGRSSNLRARSSSSSSSSIIRPSPVARRLQSPSRELSSRARARLVSLARPSSRERIGVRAINRGILKASVSRARLRPSLHSPSSSSSSSSDATRLSKSPITRASSFPPNRRVFPPTTPRARPSYLYHDTLCDL